MKKKITYQDAYHFANNMMRNKEDRQMKSLVLKSSDSDYGTVRDRIADAYILGIVAGKTVIMSE